MAPHSKKRLCPVWIGRLLASPLRKLIQDPRAILAPYVASGMRVLDIGPGMGFFSLPLAELVGDGGRVVCVDLQQGMLDALRRRARRAGVGERIETRVCREDSLAVDDLSGRIDFALAFAMVHEVGDPARLFAEIRAALKPAGRVLFAEPRGHVTEDEFRQSVAMAEAAGFRSVESPRIARSRTAVLEKM